MIIFRAHTPNSLVSSPLAAPGSLPLNSATSDTMTIPAGSTSGKFATALFRQPAKVTVQGAVRASFGAVAKSLTITP